MNSYTVPITGVWLRRIGDKIQVLVESSGKQGKHWFLVLNDDIKTINNSYIGTTGILDSVIDPLEGEHK